MRFIQYKPFDAEAVSGNSYSVAVDISSAVSVGLQVHIASGTAKGKGYIQVSLDPINTTPTNWVTIGSGADLTGAATTAYERNDVAANWARVYWNNASGTGTIDAHIKTVGY